MLKFQTNVNHCLATALVLLLGAVALVAQAKDFPPDIFGYTQQQQSNIAVFPQWLSVLERHIKEDIPEGDCSAAIMNRCHIKNWHAFLDGIRKLPRYEQLVKVNAFANSRPYVLDIDNYQLSDYWAIPKQLFNNGGDCEDYSITKMLSLRWLGYPESEVRMVVLQDLNLRVAHAVLAVAYDDDILILDNQVDTLVSHRNIVHYAPVYSINESLWWLHAPVDDLPLSVQ